VIIECTNCRSKYQYDEDRFERKPSKKIKCAKCGTVFEIFNPAFAEQAPIAPRSEATSFKREIPKRPPTLEQALGNAMPAPPAPLPRTTGKLAADLQLPHGKRLSRAVIDGPDAGSVYRVEKARVTIGRSGSDMILNDTDASRQHAAFEARDTLYTLRDLGSTNGTMFEGLKIADPVELTNHSEFLIGSSTIMLIVTDDT
jgi:hypothetical protein